MKIIDCCILFNEIEVLKIRLSMLYDYVTTFVVCESNITHSGMHKEYNFSKFQEELKPWLDKIVFLKYEPDISGLDFSFLKAHDDKSSAHWQLENGQRNFISTYLLTQNDEDFAVICDVDEIWHPRLSQYLLSGELNLDQARLEMDFHYYFMNCIGIGKENSKWAMPFFSKISLIRNDVDLSRIRSKVKMPSIENCGWHFSYLGGVDAIISKLNSFAHQEVNTPEINNAEHLLNCILTGRDYLDRPGYKWAFHPVEYYSPELVKIMLHYPEFVRWDLYDGATGSKNIIKLRGELAVALLNIKNLDIKIKSLKSERSGILQSLSWRLTKPLRELNRWIKNPKQRAEAYFKFAFGFEVSQIRQICIRIAKKILKVTSPVVQNSTYPEKKRLSSTISLELESLTPEQRKQLLIEQLRVSGHFEIATLAPKVSIIIPIYGKIEYTLRLLLSITRYPIETPFEVIIINDSSPDDSELVLSGFQWLKIINNQENQGFIRSCNLGALEAIGDFLLFLNNDTEVTPGWLDELVFTFDNLPGTGLVGSKLIYPDGLLQEAGGIVWRDASAWNFGRLQDASLPGFNYAREVDYCSGASIMIPAQLFKELHGFDEHYLPAYYEDVDLALKVREKGLRVIYQSSSVVIHHEGVTSGTDITQGVKLYQEVNKHKIHERWKKRLDFHQLPGVDVGSAKDRMAKKRVLVIDHNTPTPTKDAGSLLSFNFMMLLKEMGFQVTFLPSANFLFDELNTEHLQKVGIEVLYAPYTMTVEDHLKEFGDRYHLSVLIRPDVVEKYLPLIRYYCPGVPVIFHTIDLHFLRMFREGEIKNDSIILEAAEHMKLKETAAILNSDMTIVVSTSEKELLQNELPDAVVEVLPLIMDINNSISALKDRKGIVFVGSFAHSPNVDAVLFFVREVMPILRQRLKDFTFYVIGANPPDAIKKLETNDVVIKGYVKDLEEIYNSIRVSVAPLRFGAGIKGKVAGALSAGIPSVATSCAVEGMGCVNEVNILIADSPEEIADSIDLLYTDDELWKKISNSGLSYAENAWGAKNNYDKLRLFIKTCGIEVNDPVYPLRLYNELKGI